MTIAAAILGICTGSRGGMFSWILMGGMLIAAMLCSDALLPAEADSPGLAGYLAAWLAFNLGIGIGVTARAVYEA